MGYTCVGVSGYNSVTTVLFATILGLYVSLSFLRRIIVTELPVIIVRV